MNSVQKAILSILKAFLNNQKNIEIPDGFDWNEFDKLVRINNISGIVGYMFLQSAAGTIPAEIRKRYRIEFLTTASVSASREDSMESLIGVLKANDIDHLLFKGYVVRDLYTVPELRTFGDIDFAIKLKDRQKCDELMRQNGYQLLENWEPVYVYESAIEHYEVHTELLDSNLNEKADYRQYFKDFWEHALKKDERTYVLEPEYHLIFLLMHIAKHLYGSGAGIRMYLDIAFYIRKYRQTIDWKRFKSEIDSLKLSKFVNTVFTAVQEWFDIESPVPLEKTDNDFTERFLTFTLNGGVFGFEDKSSALTQLRKNTAEGSVSRTKTLLNRAFPPVRNMEARYTYLQTKPWLLPAAWVHRFFKKKNTTGEYLKESKELLSFDESEVLKMKQLYDEIGL